MGSASNEEREVRAARNQALFRAVNEKIVELLEGFGEIEGNMSIACECSQIYCADLVEIPPDAYWAVRGSPRTFAVLPNHIDAGVESVISKHDGYAVVEVEGHGVPVAEATFRGERATTIGKRRQGQPAMATTGSRSGQESSRRRSRR